MRNKGLDLLRIISAIAVVLIHCNAVFYFSDVQHDRMTLGIEAFINLITRFSVPCFMMISGAFSLANEKNKAVLSFYKKAFSKIALPYIGMLLFWIGIDFLKVVLGKESFRGVGINILHGTYGNLWFMPMLLLCYVITPFLIYAIKDLRERTLEGIFVFWLLWAIVSQVLTEYEVPYAIGVVFAYAAYYFAGYYIAKQPPIGRKRIVCGGGIAAVLLSISTWFRINGFDYYELDQYRAFFSPIVVYCSCYLFWIFKDMKLKKDYGKIAGLTYYVYLVHTPIIGVLQKIFLKAKSEMMGVVSLFILVVIISYGAAIVYKTICDMFYKKVVRRKIV